MQTLEIDNLKADHRPRWASLARAVLNRRGQTTIWLRRLRAGIAVLAFALVVSGCRKDAALEGIQTDANGYICLKCGVKLYTDRSVFIGPKCPKCSEDQLMPVTGYYCEKDQHLTIRAARGDRHGAVCEKCQAALPNAMRTPKRKDLEAWGATKFVP